MKYISVKQAAELWNLSERSVRNYCAQGRIEGAFLTGKTWNIPENATRPTRAVTAKKAPSTLAEILADEMQTGRKGGIYHKIQMELTYNSNHMEGSRLTADQTRYIFETNTIGGEITTLPRDVHAEMRRLLSDYENGAPKTLDDIVEFHARFEKIHPFQYGNGRVGRLIMFKECLRSGVVPFIIDESIKMLYYNGLKNWDSQHGYLISTCQLAQDAFREMMGYFEIMEV